MQCVIPNQNLRILVRGLHSLARIGDELYVEPGKDGISFRTVNAAQSAYSSLFFNLSFFGRYKCDFPTEEAGTCKISMRACLRVFKSPNCMDRHVESCKIEIGEECSKLIFKIQFSQGYTKTHFLSVNDNETVQLKYNKTEMKNEVSILPRTLHRAVKYFGQKDEEITFDVTEDKVNLKNYFDNSEVENQKVVRTNFCLNRSDFETYHVNLPNSITFALRELRAVCAFSESSNSVIGMHFEMCGKPVIFTVENPLYQADYVVSTLPPEIISGERPYRRSQLSDIASSMPSNSVVNSTKKRRLAPVSEEIAEPIGSLATDLNSEPGPGPAPIMEVVQVEVHQPPNCTPDVQQNRSQRDVTIVPQAQRCSQNYTNDISQIQRNSQGNVTGVAPIQRSQGTISGIAQIPSNSQNNVINVSQEQRNSQNNITNVSQVQRNSQNMTSGSQTRRNSQNITNVSQVQRNSQNITGGSQVQRNSQNMTSGSQARHNSQNITGGSQVQRNSQNITGGSQIQRNSQNCISNVPPVQRSSQNCITNIAQVSSRCSFGTSNESDTNLDELMMRIEVNSEFFQDTHQNTVANGLTGLNESQVQKIKTVFEYCFEFPASFDSDFGEVLYENDD